MRRAIAIALALVACRAVIWVIFEQAHFDSDQAVVGLMAKHLSEGRAFPLFFYGQPYLLAVEAWLVAPVFWIFGPSVLTLKLPIVFLNGVVAVLLLRILVQRVGLPPAHALVACLFFLLPPPVTSSRLVEAAGGHIEPLIYVLLLWLLRERALPFGLLAGLAVLNREFSAYGIAAIGAIDLFTGRLRDRSRWRFYAIAAVGAVAVMTLARLLKPHADLLGPGTRETLDAALSSEQVAFWKSAFCWRPTELAQNVRWLFGNNLATLFGWRVEPLGGFVRSALSTGFSLAWVPLAGALGLAASAWTAAPAIKKAREADAFPVYLMLVGVQAAVVYTGLGCLVRDGMLIRYTLLTLFVPIGAVAWALARQPPPWQRGALIALVLSWAAPAAIDNIRVVDEYIRHRPPSPYRALVDFLETQGVRYARAPYWTAYHVDFLSGERITVASYDRVRVQEYERIVDTNVNRSAGIFEHDPCPNDLPFLQWCLTDLSRAKIK